MSSFDRRTLIGAASLCAVAVLTGCGFQPVHGAGADTVSGTVAIEEAVDPETFAFRERMRRRIGHAGSEARYALEYRLEMEEEPVAINTASDVTRYQVEAVARWRLIGLAAGDVVSGGSVKTNGGYDATAAPFATRTAQRTEREELAKELAELVSVRLLAFAAPEE